MERKKKKIVTSSVDTIKNANDRQNIKVNIERTNRKIQGIGKDRPNSVDWIKRSTLGKATRMSGSKVDRESEINAGNPRLLAEALLSVIEEDEEDVFNTEITLLGVTLIVKTKLGDHWIIALDMITSKR